MSHDILISKLANVRMMAAGRLPAVDVETIDEVIGFLAERQPTNFCPDCGKRNGPAPSIHTCTPPVAKTNRDQSVAVDPDYFWRPMRECPLGVKVQLLGIGGVATYGNYIRGDAFWHGWAPLPKARKTS